MIRYVGADRKGSRTKQLVPLVPCEEDAPIGDVSGALVLGEYPGRCSCAPLTALLVTVLMLGWCSCLALKDYRLEQLAIHSRYQVEWGSPGQWVSHMMTTRPPHPRTGWCGVHCSILRYSGKGVDIAC